MPSLDTSITSVGLPTLVRSFSVTFHQAQWILIAYLLAVTSLIVGVGKFADLFGRKRLLLTGITVFTSATILCSIAPSISVLIAARAIEGVGAAMMMAIAIALAGGTIPGAKVGTAMGLLGTMSAVGTTLGPSLGGLLLAWFGWHSIFLVNAPLGMFNLYLTHRYVPSDQPRIAESKAYPDVTGILLLALTLAAYALAMTLGKGSFGHLNFILLATSMCGIFVFYIIERRVKSPLVDFRMLEDSVLKANLLSSALVSTVIMSTLVVGPFYLSRTLQLNTGTVGLVMSSGPLLAAFAGVPAGRVVDRFGAWKMTTLGLIGVGVGCFSLALLPTKIGIPGYVVPLLLVTGSYSLFQTANNTVAIQRSHQSQRGLVSGMLSLCRYFGLITGATVMGAIFAQASKTTSLTISNARTTALGMKTVFALSGLLIVIAVAIVSASRLLAATAQKPAMYIPEGAIQKGTEN